MPHKYWQENVLGRKENITKSARFNDFSWLFLLNNHSNHGLLEIFNLFQSVRHDKR